MWRGLLESAFCVPDFCLNEGPGDIAAHAADERGKLMRVYMEVQPPTLSRAMHRVNTALREYAPAEIEFAPTPHVADLQVLHVIGMGSLEYLAREQYVLLQYCFLTTEQPASGCREAFWLSLFRAARLVMSYYDLPSLVGSPDFPFYRTPLGVDGTVFHDRRHLPRPACVLTTGHEASGEAIRECREAAARVNQPMIHVGSDFDFMGDGCLVVNGVSDDRMAELYSEARYVSGLRRGEGFELPIIEGLACGARPICFNQPAYRHWFDDHAVFVPETDSITLTEAIAEVLHTTPRPVSPSEREQVLSRFSWKRICEDFWARVLRS
jgi:glycosyltransferase involved in cell wall biosynthesis